VAAGQRVMRDPRESPRVRRNIRLTVALLALAALGFYLAFFWKMAGGG